MHNVDYGQSTITLNKKLWTLKLIVLKLIVS